MVGGLGLRPSARPGIKTYTPTLTPAQSALEEVQGCWRRRERQPRQQGTWRRQKETHVSAGGKPCALGAALARGSSVISVARGQMGAMLRAPWGGVLVAAASAAGGGQWRQVPEVRSTVSTCEGCS